MIRLIRILIKLIEDKISFYLMNDYYGLHDIDCKILIFCVHDDHIISDHIKLYKNMVFQSHVKFKSNILQAKI